jgi:hypothetical protein
VDEVQWLACQDWRPLLEFLGDKVSDRKLRLFLAACYRQLWGHVPGEVTHAAVTLSEHFAEAGGVQTIQALVRIPAGSVVINCGASNPVGPLGVLGEGTLQREVDLSASNPLQADLLARLACWRNVMMYPDWLVDSLERAGLSRPRQAGLFRDVVRGPFRPLLVRAAWRRWREGTVLGIAQGIYHDRAFEQLPILADALLDAGCADEELLAHCRSGAEHVRGCWAVDCVLGRS